MQNSIMSNFIIVPKTIGESATSAGYLEITGRHVVQESFHVYLTSLIDDTRGRVHILTDEVWKEYEMTLRFDGVSGPHEHLDIHSYTTEILLKPGKYTVKPKN